MVMSDGKTDTVWSHLTGEGLSGKHKGRQLGSLPTYNLTWGEWRKRHPETTVLALDARYSQYYAPSGRGRKGLGKGRSGDGAHLGAMFRKTLTGKIDERLDPDALVLGVTAGEAWKAYPLDKLAGDAVQDELGGVPLLVLQAGGGAMAFDRRLDGKTLTFEGRKDHSTGSLWDAEGHCVEGALKGKSLKPVFAIVTEWYGWSGFRPETGIYGAEKP